MPATTRAPAACELVKRARRNGRRSSSVTPQDDVRAAGRVPLRTIAIADRHAYKLVGGVRVMVGVALLVNPGYWATGWVGPGSRRPDAAFLARVIGVRDLAHGIAQITTHASRANATAHWEAVLVDAFDTALTWRTAPGRQRALIASTAAFNGLLNVFAATR